MTKLNFLRDSEVLADVSEYGARELQRLCAATGKTLSLSEAFAEFGHPLIVESIEGTEVTADDYELWLNTIIDLCAERGLNCAKKSVFMDTAFDMLDNDSKIDMLDTKDIERLKRTVASILWNNYQVRKAQDKLGMRPSEEEEKLAPPVDGDTQFSDDLRTASGMSEHDVPDEEFVDDHVPAEDGHVDTDEGEPDTGWAETFIDDHPEVLDMDEDELTSYLFQNHPEMTLGQVLQLDDFLGIGDDTFDDDEDTTLDADLEGDGAQVPDEPIDTAIAGGFEFDMNDNPDKEEPPRPVHREEEETANKATWVENVRREATRAAKRDARDGRRTYNPYPRGTSRHKVWAQTYSAIGEIANGDARVNAREEEEEVRTRSYSAAMQDGKKAAAKYLEVINKWIETGVGNAEVPPNPFPENSPEHEAWQEGFDDEYTA